jgi:predicted transcriptional regulator
MLRTMDVTSPTSDKLARAGRRETQAERQHRLAREADAADAQDPGGAELRWQRTLIGLADVDAGRLIDDDAMRACADSLGTDQELPVPEPD